jgi:L-aspartate oxidase
VEAASSFAEAASPGELTYPALDDLQHQRCELAQLMWNYAAISRSQAGLERAIATLATWRQDAHCQPWPTSLKTLIPGITRPLPKGTNLAVIRAWGELRNLYDTAWLVLNSAAFRTESRGGHFREDYPQTNPTWQVHTLVENDQWSKSNPISSSHS